MIFSKQNMRNAYNFSRIEKEKPKIVFSILAKQDIEFTSSSLFNQIKYSSKIEEFICYSNHDISEY